MSNLARWVGGTTTTTRFYFFNEKERWSTMYDDGTVPSSHILGCLLDSRNLKNKGILQAIGNFADDNNSRSRLAPYQQSYSSLYVKHKGWDVSLLLEIQINPANPGWPEAEAEGTKIPNTTFSTKLAGWLLRQADLGHIAWEEKAKTHVHLLNSEECPWQTEILTSQCGSLGITHWELIPCVLGHKAKGWGFHSTLLAFSRLSQKKISPQLFWSLFFLFPPYYEGTQVQAHLWKCFFASCIPLIWLPSIRPKSLLHSRHNGTVYGVMIAHWTICWDSPTHENTHDEIDERLEQNSHDYTPSHVIDDANYLKDIFFFFLR